MQLHPATFNEAVLRGLVQLSGKAQSSVSRQSSVEVVHGDDRSNAFENHVRHDERI
jgi:hypothetical protein